MCSQQKAYPGKLKLGAPACHFFGGAVQFNKCWFVKEFCHKKVPQVFIFSNVGPFDSFATYSVWHGWLEDIIQSIYKVVVAWFLWSAIFLGFSYPSTEHFILREGIVFRISLPNVVKFECFGGKFLWMSSWAACMMNKKRIGAILLPCCMPVL